MPYISCERCGKEFYSKPSWVKKGKGRYCSVFCSSQSNKTGRMIKCHLCGEKTYKQSRLIKRSKSGYLFCSKKCSLKWKNETFVGENNKNWKYGENSESYRNILRRSNVPVLCKICRNKDNRVLIVHHKDGYRKNNQLSNLVWLCCNCHFLVHHYLTEANKLKK